MLNEIKNKLEALGATITDFNLGNPVEDYLIEKIEKQFSIMLPQEVRNFYKLHNGLSIFWEIDNQAAGCIDFWSLERMFGGYNATPGSELRSNTLKDYFWEDGYHKGKDLAFRKELRMLEPHNGLDSSTAIHFSKNGEVKLYYVKMDAVIELPFSFEEYCNFVKITLGIDEGRYHLQNADFYSSSIFDFLPDVNKLSLSDINELDFLKDRKLEILFEK